MTAQINPGRRKQRSNSTAMLSSNGKGEKRSPTRHQNAAFGLTISDYPYVRSSVGVLPFVNMTGEPNLDRLSDDFTERVVNAIRATSGSDMAKLCPSLPTNLENIHYLDISRWLGVDLLLVGEVRKEENALYASAQLVFAASGLPVRSFRIESMAAVPLAHERSIADQLARQLEAALLAAARPAAVA